MLEEQAVEERLVTSVQRLEPDVLVERVGHPPQVLEHARHLLFLSGDERREEPAQAERVALGFGERGPFVERWIAQQVDAARERRIAGGSLRGHGSPPVS